MPNLNNDRAKKHLLAASKPFEDWYDSLQKNFSHLSLETSTITEALVDSASNASASIYRWYSLKESYSASLPSWVLQRAKSQYQHCAKQVLDPFMGAGTTGVALSSNEIQVDGVEYNPFIRFVARAKAKVSRVELSDLKKAIHKLKGLDYHQPKLEIPELSTLHHSEYITRYSLEVLLSAQKHIERLNTTLPAKAVLKIGVASVVEQAFNLRKDGRALRYIPDHAVRGVQKAIFGKWDQIVSDVESFQASDSLTRPRDLFNVYAGSATNLSLLTDSCNHPAALIDGSYDTVIYSPPYLNNFDYSEVYKLELWLLGFISNYDDWKDLRLGTLRSHPSVSFPQTNYLADDSATCHVAAKLDAMGDSLCLSEKTRVSMKRTIKGYFEDIYLALKEQWRVLKPGGLAVYVVANSRHHYLPIATDVIIAEIARCIGFEPLELVVLRKRNGRTRQKLFLHESAVFLKKNTSL